LAAVGQIRGALLEEAVLFLLRKVGYKIVYSPNDSIDPTDVREGHSGLELQGRGIWHQIDAIAEQHHTPAFMYPLRLLVEAKFYASNPVGANVVRNAVGVLKDISENYFTKHRVRGSLGSVRFNYQSAIFGVSGFTKPAVQYAVAHQIFLLEYKNIPIIQPVIDAIRRIDEDCLTRQGVENISEVRNVLRQALGVGAFPIEAPILLTHKGIEVVNEGIAPALQSIGGSYFGMLQGRWPLHLLTRRPLPAPAFRNDTVQCRLRGDRNGYWRFTPSGVMEGNAHWFELQFFLPPELAELVADHWDDPGMVAQTKEQNFSFISLSGLIGEKWRSVRLELDREWLVQYINRIRT